MIIFSSLFQVNPHTGSYSYSWQVNDVYSGNDFGHREARGPSGDSFTTEGEYYVKLPDGRVQTVTYFVDPYSGYRAKVLYKGAPKPYTPVPSPSVPRPTYQPFHHPKPPPPPRYNSVNSYPYRPASVRPTNVPQPSVRPTSVLPSSVHHSLTTPKPELHHHDPYFRSESELRGRDFSSPLFYISTKKIKPRKKDHHDKIEGVFDHPPKVKGLPKKFHGFFI